MIIGPKPRNSPSLASIKREEQRDRLMLPHKGREITK